MKKNIFLYIILSVVLPSLSFAKDQSQYKTLTVITHESEPYMSEKMPGQGAILTAVNAILNKHGYQMKAVFAPSWTRAKMDLMTKANIDGVVPVRVKEREDLLQFSDFNVLSPWIMVERKDKPINWSKPEDLKGLRAGNVHGVELRPGVKELVDKKVIQLEVTPSATQSLLQLANRRIDFLFTDPFIFNYTMATDPELEAYRDQLQINARPWYVEHYGIAFKKSVDPKVVKAINGSWAEFNRHIDDYLKNMIMEASMKAKSAKAESKK